MTARTEGGKAVYMLAAVQEHWARKWRQGLSPGECRVLIQKQRGLCALSGVPLRFDAASGTPVKGGPGCHPLYAALDHVDPGNKDGRRQIVCYALNDLKGHLSVPLFEALQGTPAWRDFIAAWREQAERDPKDRKAFRALIRPGASPR